MLIATNHRPSPQYSPGEHATFLFTPLTSATATTALPELNNRSQQSESSAEHYFQYHNPHCQMLSEAGKDDEYFEPPADINVSLPASNDTRTTSVSAAFHSTHGFTSDDNLVLPRTLYNTRQQRPFPSSSSQYQQPPPPISIIRHSGHRSLPNKRRKVSEASIAEHPAAIKATSAAPDVTDAVARPFPVPHPLLVTPIDATGPSAPSSTSSSPQAVILAPPVPEELRYHIVLQAPTAATQISDGPPTTYLNRGQPYWLRLTDRFEQDTVITSTLIIMFHEPTHRNDALNYWKFWQNQQHNPETARAVFLDEQQPSEGIYNIRFSSFDRIQFEWNGRVGAKILVRFNCLSTDFSRIKGVKGIPLRIQVESKETSTYATTAPGPSPDQYAEQSFCKIKLFRDKGAERKNKDDAKQIWKHMERIYGSGRQQPYWLTYNQPRPYTVLSSTSSIPRSPLLDTAEDAIGKTSRTSSSRGHQYRKSRKLPAQRRAAIAGKRQTTSSRSTSTCETTGTSPTVPVSSIGPPTSSGPSATLSTQCSFFVHVKTTQHQRFHKSPVHHSNKERLYPIRLDENSSRVADLVSFICPILSLDASQVSEILWQQRHHPSSSSTETAALITVTGTHGDEPHCPFTRHLTPGSIISVEWEIIVDGTVRLVFQF